MSSSLVHMERLECRYVLELYFKLESPLSIGSGEGDFRRIPLTFTVEGKRIPIIPAESLAGSLRSLASSLFATMFPSHELSKYHRKDSHVRKENREELKQKYYEKAKEELRIIFPEESLAELESEADGAQLLEYYLTLKCPVCRLFGGKGVSGKILLSDGLPDGKVEFFTYASNAIDRRTRTVARDRLFEVIAVKPDETLRYKFKIIIDNVIKGTDDAILLSLLLDFIRRFGLSLGGLKSRGYGKLSLDSEKSSVKVLSIEANPRNEEDFIKNIKALLMKERYFQKMSIEEFIEWLR